MTGTSHRLLKDGKEGTFNEDTGKTEETERKA
jgi:hypothetical protein